VDTSDIERAFRAESGRAVATLVRFFGDIDLAEEGAVAGDRPPAQPGRLDHHHRPQPGDRSDPPGVHQGRPPG
jgi:hypothetical protein